VTEQRKPRRSLLFVAQLAPPSPLVAARRVGGLTKYLARLGNRVTVLSSRVSGEGEIDGAFRVERTRDLLTSPLNWRRGHFQALTGSQAAMYGKPSALESVIVPDLALASWVPFALARALALARTDPFDCVVTTSPPQSAHLIGLALRRRLGVCWVADFRDGWTFEPPHAPWPVGLQRRGDRLLERLVVAGADCIVGVTKPIVEDLRARFGVEAALITNGFDPEEVAVDGLDPLLDPERRSLVHTGRMAIARSTPQPLLEAFRYLRQEAPEVADRMELVFAGPLSQAEEQLLTAPGLAGNVRWVGALERERTLALQRAADALLVVTEGAGRSSVATGKLFEYLGARRPILVLGEGTEAARIVSETGAGITTSASDPVAIAAGLRRIAAHSRDDGPSEGAIASYSYPRLAEQLCELIDAIARG
jgi:glycosyltransferase involved in cell wall biosynthesis